MSLSSSPSHPGTAPARPRGGAAETHVPPGHGPLATVDLGAIAANWRTMAARAGRAECGAAVKANAYGLGLEPVATALHAAGCRRFFVAHLVEGEKLRAALPDATIHVLNGLLPGTAAAIVAARLVPVLASPAEVEEWATVSHGAHPAFIQVDTAMNRLGLTAEEARALAERPDLVAATGATHLLSHLSMAEVSAAPLNRAQRDRFAALKALFPTLKGSFANSAGTVLGDAFTFDLVRPGIALYGGDVSDAAPDLVRPVVTLLANVLQVHAARAGEVVGYGATVTLARDSRLAVLSLGYADGFNRHALRPDSGAGIVLHGRFAPFVGRVSMDLSVVDVTDIPEARRGDLAEVIGPNRPLAAYAKALGTIDYEALTSLGRRTRFQYLPA
jgi:alanine racemase